MNSAITAKWIVKRLRKDDDFLKDTVFVYPRGVRKPELPTAGREKRRCGCRRIIHVRIAVSRTRNERFPTEQ